MKRYIYGWYMFCRFVYKARTKKHGVGAQPWGLSIKMAACARHVVDGQHCRPPRLPHWMRTIEWV